MMSSVALVRQAAFTRPLSTLQGWRERAFAVWFDSLVYNQIWEDPRVDLQALELAPGSRVVTIASGGCNILNYLAHASVSIVAVDINQYHIYLTRLKLAALKALPTYRDFFAFFGLADGQSNPQNYYRYICQHLDQASRTFWEGGSWLRTNVLGPRINYFAQNFYNYAKLGYLLRFAHLLAKVTRRHPERLLKARTLEEQARIFSETIAPFFDHKLVRLIGQQRLIMYSLGIPPQQYENIRRESAGGVIALYRERVRRLTCTFPIADNYFAWQALGRRYDTEEKCALPDYLKEEHYDTVKQRSAHVETLVLPLTQYLKLQPQKSLDRFVLLDAQDWMRREQIEELWREIERTGRPGARIIFRTGGRKSVIEDALPPVLRRRFVYDEPRSRELHQQDRAAIYGGFHLYVMPE